MQGPGPRVYVKVADHHHHNLFMARFYQEQDAPLFDYELYTLGGRPLRGPQSAWSADKDYIAYLGAAQTFGRYLNDPFSLQIGRHLEVGTLNLSMGGAGPYTYLENSEHLDLINQSSLVVLQVMSARSINSSVFESQMGTNLGWRLPGREKMHSGKVIQALFTGEDPRGQDLRFIQALIDEMRRKYMAAMLELIGEIRPPVVILWFATREPGDIDELDEHKLAGLSQVARSNSAAAFSGGKFPQLVDSSMWNTLSKKCDACVKCVTNADLPQSIRFPDGTERLNPYYPTQTMHDLAFEALLPACRELIQT